MLKNKREVWMLLSSKLSGLSGLLPPSSGLWKRTSTCPLIKSFPPILKLWALFLQLKELPNRRKARLKVKLRKSLRIRRKLNFLDKVLNTNFKAGMSLEYGKLKIGSILWKLEMSCSLTLWIQENSPRKSLIFTSFRKTLCLKSLFFSLWDFSL